MHDADCPMDAKFVTRRLEEAGAALLALPNTGYSTKLRSSNLDIVRTALESYGWSEKRIRPAVPSAAAITRMDEAMGWIAHIPIDRYVLRRIVGARSLVNPLTDRYLYPWRRLATALGADHKAVQRWHAEGIGLIVTGLARGSTIRCPATPPPPAAENLLRRPPSPPRLPAAPLAAAPRRNARGPAAA